MHERPLDGLLRKHVWIAGQVQGVFFRESTRREAERAGVAGWVRNLPDGRVEAVFEGPPEAVEAMVRWSQHGPDSAIIDDFQERDEPPAGEATFRVLR